MQVRKEWINGCDLMQKTVSKKRRKVGKEYRKKAISKLKREARRKMKRVRSGV